MSAKVKGVGRANRARFQKSGPVVRHGVAKAVKLVPATGCRLTASVARDLLAMLEDVTNYTGEVR